MSLFFAPVFGMQTTNQQAFAQASTYTVQSVTAFQNVSSLQVGMLPVTFDVAVWRDFVKNGTITGSGDQFAGVSVQQDPNDSNLNMLQIYSSVKSVGNFGALPINGVNTGDIKTQVVTGMTQTMYSTLLAQNNVTSTSVVPLAPFDLNSLAPTSVPSGSHDPGIAPASTSGAGPYGSWNWTGQSGFISSNAQSINTYPGVYLLPLFRALDDGQSSAGGSATGSPFSSSTYTAGMGQGSNFYYNIVDFVAVQLMDTSYMSQNNNKNVYVEPSAMVLTFDQVVGTPPTITGPPTTGTLNTIFVAPRLTR